MTRRGTGRSERSRAAPEPGFEQALRLRLREDPRAGDAGRGFGQRLGPRHVGIDVTADAGPHLDRHFLRDAALPLVGTGRDDLGRPGTQGGQEGQDRDHRGERPARRRIGGDKGRVASQGRRQAGLLVGCDGHRGTRV